MVRDTVMERGALKVVVADDEDMNLEILVKTITDAGHEVFSFEDGDLALQYIKDNPNNVDIVILDKLMPRLHGLEVMRRLKSDPALKDIPVILQTGDVGIGQLQEGLEAGAYYYLSKPFYPEMLISLLNAAARDCIKPRHLEKEKPATNLLRSGVFEARSLEEASALAASLSYYAVKPDAVNLAIFELMANAIEHGNLEIGYDEKNALLQKGTFHEEINRRMALPENLNKYIRVTFEKTGNKAALLIEDQGKGFDWKKYLNYDPTRLTDPNGRGIASSNLMKLDMEYIGNGSKVKCRFYIGESW